jgi:hypothetical protein
MLDKIQLKHQSGSFLAGPCLNLTSLRRYKNWASHHFLFGRSLGTDVRDHGPCTIFMARSLLVYLQVQKGCG